MCSLWSHPCLSMITANILLDKSAWLCIERVCSYCTLYSVDSERVCVEREGTQGGLHGAWSRVLLELKCWQCLFVQPCDMIYVWDTECKCPACDQQTKQQTKPEDQENWLYTVFQPLSHSSSLSFFLSLCSAAYLSLPLSFVFNFTFTVTGFTCLPLSAHAPCMCSPHKQGTLLVVSHCNHTLFNVLLTNEFRMASLKMRVAAMTTKQHMCLIRFLRFVPQLLVYMYCWKALLSNNSTTWSNYKQQHLEAGFVHQLTS